MNLDPSQDPFRADQVREKETDTLGLVALILGCIAFSGLIILGLGAIIGVVGLIVGLVALARKGAPKAMAAIGTALSALSIMLGILIGVGIYYGIRMATEMTGDMMALQQEGLRDWEGVIAPELDVPLNDGNDLLLEDYLGSKVVLYVQPPFLPFNSDGWTPLLNELDSESSEEYFVLGLMVASPELVPFAGPDISMEFPYAATDEVDAPYVQVELAPVVFIVDRAGVIQHVFVQEPDLDTLRDAATGPDFEGEVLDAPAELAEDDAEADFAPAEIEALGKEI